jgi:glycosyltransferase involved in cell wall biosynthesis
MTVSELIALEATPATARRIALSVVIPVYNEHESLPLIYGRFVEVLAAGPALYRDSYEILLVDDGSTDASLAVAAELQQADPRVRVVQFRRNFGKTAALQAGFRLARGERVVTIDADMQEDPADTFRLLEQLDAGFDLVSAWRQKRNDPISKTWPSRVFNTVVARLTGVPLHDFNCGFKAYSGEVVRDLRLYGDLHRFIPVLASQQGFRVAEVPVEHSPRRYGKSKFGARRLGRGYLFGALGTTLCLAGAMICAYLTVLWLQGQRPIGDRPLLTLGVLLLITGLQFFSTGLVGEMLRHSSYQQGDEYSIRRVLETKE